MAQTSSQQDSKPLKFTLTHYRKQKHTHEAFMNWMVEKHLRLAMPVFKKHGLLGYALFDTPGPMNESLKQGFGQLHPTWDFADFDCVIEYTLPDAQSIQNVVSDPDWAASVADQEDWVDTSRSLVSLGYHIPYLLESGEVVNMPK